MGFPRKLLNEGEDLVLDLRPHWWALAGPVAALVAAVVIGVVALALDLDDWVKIVAAALVLIALIWFGIRYALWATTTFVLTSDRLISRSGVLSKSGIEIPLERINTVFFNQALFERVIGSGDLAVESAGERGTQSFSNIRRPAAIQREIYVQMESNNARMHRGVVGVEQPSPAPAGGGSSIPDQIEQLADMHRRGLLSAAEFETKKAELLRRM